MTKFTDEVEIDAPTQVGLVVTGPVAGVGAGAQLATTGTGGRGWEILATGQAAAQGQDKLNIRDLGNGTDVITITSDGKVGIGTTLPFAALAVVAPDASGLSVSGPGAPGVGAGVSLAPAGSVGGGTTGSFLPAWQILATGETAPQGSGKLNFSCLVGANPLNATSIDAFTITSDSKVGIGTTNPGFKLEVDAPDQLGFHVTGPNPGVGAGISVHTIDPSLGAINRWEILATGSAAAQGSGRLNIRDLATGEDIFTIVKDGVGANNDAIGIGTTSPSRKLEVNGDVGAKNIVVTGDVILVGQDCAEKFELARAEHNNPGTVMIVNEQGTLEPCQRPYDKKVAGVVSGAGDCKPGIILGGESSERPKAAIALFGKVFCKVDAGCGAIEIGDLLTTSPTAGHAMKATDPLKAFGTVVGKALQPLPAGQGLIPILVALQ